MDKDKEQENIIEIEELEEEDSENDVKKNDEEGRKETVAMARNPLEEEESDPDMEKTMSIDMLGQTEGEGDEEKTRIIDVPVGKYTLVVLYGPDQGRQYPITKERVIIGRGINTDITLNDPTVSRRHCEIYIQGPDYWIKDLGSGNGTKIAAQRIMQPVKLNDNTRIEIGQTTLLFTSNPAGVRVDTPPQRPVVNQGSYSNAQTLSTRMPSNVQNMGAPRHLQPKRTNIPAREESSSNLKVAILVVLLLILIGGGGIAAFVLLKGKGKEEKRVVHHQEQAVDSSEYQVFLDHADDALSKKLWKTAIDYLNKAKDAGAPVKLVESRIKKAKDELENYKRIRRAESAIEDKNFDMAKTLLESIPKSSVYFIRAAGDLSTIKKEVRNLEIKQVKALIAAGRRKDAQDLFTQLIQKYPTDTQVLELTKLFKKSEMKEINTRIKTKAQVKPKARRIVRRRHRKRVKLDFNQVLAMYATQNFDDAIQKIQDYLSESPSGQDAIRARKLMKNIKDFASGYSQATSAMSTQAYTKAIRILQRIKGIDLQISGHYQSKIKQMLISAYTSRAAVFLTSRQYIFAARDARAALALDPNNKKANLILSACTRAAKKYFVEAKSDVGKGNVDEAKRKLQMVMRIVSRNTQLYKDAAQLYQQVR